uniref:Uncharacterized protein n=1 Tax=Pygocentrus nattereri TaxID=42514 RepID=A0A3B4DCT1_PYGNA
MRSSIDWPPSRRFSISTSRPTPSTTICTSSTSEKPSRSALEMSKTPPTAAVSTPPGQRNIKVQGQDIFLKSEKPNITPSQLNTVAAIYIKL